MVPLLWFCIRKSLPEERKNEDCKIIKESFISAFAGETFGEVEAVEEVVVTEATARDAPAPVDSERKKIVHQDPTN